VDDDRNVTTPLELQLVKCVEMVTILYAAVAHHAALGDPVATEALARYRAVIDQRDQAAQMTRELTELVRENVTLWRLARFAQYDSLEAIEAMLAKGA
jgi:hypothetical protein